LKALGPSIITAAAAATDGGGEANGIAALLQIVLLALVLEATADDAVKGHPMLSRADAGGDWRVWRRRCSHKPVLCFS